MDTESMRATGYLDLVRNARGGAANVLVRALVGPVFLSEGIHTFLYSDALGVCRFAKIGRTKSMPTGRC
jgi:hypothetical protein